MVMMMVMEQSASMPKKEINSRKNSHKFSSFMRQTRNISIFGHHWEKSVYTMDIEFNLAQPPPSCFKILWL